MSKLDHRRERRAVPTERTTGRTTVRAAPSEDELRRLLRREPRHVEALVHLGALEGRAGQWASAETRLLRALDLEPDHVGAHNNLGKVLMASGRTVQALQAFERVVQLRPDHARAHFNRAQALHRLGRLDDAVSAAGDALALAPQQPEARQLRAGLMTERARQLRHEGRLEEARHSVEGALATCPDSLEAMELHASLLSALCRQDDLSRDRDQLVGEAVRAYHLALAHGADKELTAYALAALSGEGAPSASPREYVRLLFDASAHEFDTHLLEHLAYRTPALLVADVLALAGSAEGSVLDLGCGTGLCGPLLRPAASSLTGVDLSERMLELARARGCYDDLACAEAVEYVRERPEAFDLVIAADVLVYVGDLEPLMGAVRAGLKAGGRFGFSVEALEDPLAKRAGFALRPTRRYAHAAAYVRTLAQAFGFEVEHQRDCELRQEAGAGVWGHLFVLRAAQLASA